MEREMVDSNIKWAGIIPVIWETRKIKYSLQERVEKNNPIKTNEILSLTAKQGVVPYGEKEGGGNKPKEDLRAYRLAYPGDIVMNSMNILSGAVGLSSYFGCVSPVYYMLRPYNKDEDVRYYNYIFQTTVFQRSLLGLGNGILIKESGNGNFNTIRMRISMDKFGELLIPIAPTNEQRKIADHLDKKCNEIDSLSLDIQSQINILENYKKSVITESVIKGLNPNVEMKDSQNRYLGKIPKHWAEKRLRFLGTCQNGISKSSEFFGEGYPFVSYGDVYRNFFLPINVKGLVKSSKSDRNIYSVKYGDIFFTRTSETIEEIGFSSTCLETIDNATFAGFLIRFRPYNQNELTPEFAQYYFRSDIHRKFFVKEMNLVTRASLSQDLLKRLPVLLPPIKEQKEISKHLDSICSEIDGVVKDKQKQLEILEQYKKSLIYEYVTGKKRL